VIKRTFSTIALWAVVIGTVCYGGAVGSVLLLAVFSTLAQYELHGLLGKSGLPPWPLAPLVLGFAIVLQAGLNLSCGIFVWPIAAVALIMGTLACAQNPAAISRLAGSVLAVAYVPIMLLFYAMIMRGFGLACLRGEGVGLAIWVVAVAKFTDVGGYLVGSLIGRHKLAPSISPGKTWEGVAGGLALAMLIGCGIWKFAPDWLPRWFTLSRTLWLPLPIGMAAIASDLSESALKRRAGVKDSGRCIPGIGGALDLADSLLLTAPIAYYLFYCLQANS
jgi:phosphatidate cytidylyltransferase